jgi:hypothetical protein
MTWRSEVIPFAVGSWTTTRFGSADCPGFEKHPEEISPLSTPADMAQVLAISERYGKSFPG